MLTPIVTSLAYCFPQSVMGLAANEEPKNQENEMTTYDDFFEGYFFTDAFDTVDPNAFDNVDPDADDASAIQGHSNALTDDEQSLLCDIESLTSSDEYSNRSIDSRLNDKDGFHFGSEAKTKSRGGDSKTEVYEEWISNACRQLNIVKNPLLWNEKEVRSWCEWALSQYQVRPARRKTLLNNLRHNGISFCQLQEKDFTQLFHSAGIYVYAELELWKNATEISSTDLASVELMALSQSGVTSTNSRTHCLWSASQASASQEPVKRIPTNTNSSNEFLTLTDAASFCQESRHSFAISDSSSIDVNQASITSDSFDSASFPPPPSSTSSWSKIPTFVLESVLCDDSFADSSASSDETARGSFTDSGRRPGDAAAAIDGPGTLRFGGFGVGDTDSTSSSAHSHFSIFHRESAKVDPVAVCSEEWEAEEEEEEGPFSTKHGHQLWQFLQELLRAPSAYDDCIRWIDRHRGIFKIEDSVRVARLWGQRKNRPAMNYDKLSRSIRQYYKKGIIQKTSESRRLVYQFCPKYNI